eukprot:10209690-Lingulodinium_polyedra.AAC.1
MGGTTRENAHDPAMGERMPGTPHAFRPSASATTTSKPNANQIAGHPHRRGSVVQYRPVLP